MNLRCPRCDRDFEEEKIGGELPAVLAECPWCFSVVFSFQALPASTIASVVAPETAAGQLACVWCGASCETCRADESAERLADCVNCGAVVFTAPGNEAESRWAWLFPPDAPIDERRRIYALYRRNCLGWIAILDHDLELRAQFFTMRVDPDELLLLADGREVDSPAALVIALRGMTDEIFSAHVSESRHDFASWAGEAFADDAVKERLEPARTPLAVRLKLLQYAANLDPSVPLAE